MLVRHSCFFFTLLWLASLPLVAQPPQSTGQGTETGDPPPATQEESASEESEAAEGAEATAEELERPYHLCVPPELPRKEWLDWFRRQLHRSACATAMWVDGFFGNEQYTAEIDETNGRVALRTFYDEFEGFDVSLRAHISFVFPNIDRRFSAFAGRENEEEAIEGRETDLPGAPLFLEEFEDQEWLVGLGYNPLAGKRRRLSFSGGVKIRSPLEPYAKARYRRRFFFGERTLLHMRDTVFWTSQRGFGNTAVLELTHVLRDDLLIRSSSFGTIAEDTDGVDWKTVLTLYHSISPDRAFAYEFGWQGETDAPVTVDKIGLQVTYRQRLWREWFFGEITTGVSWPRDFPHQPREPSFLIGIGSEIHFGRQP